MSNPFMTDTRFGEARINAHAFAEALAPHMGATVEAAREEMDRPDLAALILPCGIRLSFRRLFGAGKAAHVECNAGAHGLTLSASDWPSHIKFPSATVNTGRPLEAIAKDLTRRVVEPAKPHADELRSKAAAVDDVKARMRATLAAFQAAHPEVRATMDQDERSASLFSGPVNGVYFTARLAPDGSAYFERVGSIGPEHAAKVLAVLLAP